ADRSSDLKRAEALLTSSVYLSLQPNSPSQKISNSNLAIAHTPFFRPAGLFQPIFSHALTNCWGAIEWHHAATLQPHDEITQVTPRGALLSINRAILSKPKHVRPNG